MGGVEGLFRACFVFFELLHKYISFSGLVSGPPWLGRCIPLPLDGTLTPRMAGVTLVLMASLGLHATQAPYAKAGHFWDVGSDFHGKKPHVYVEIWVEVS